MKKKEVKSKILKVFKKNKGSWLSTNKVSSLSGVNWYRVEDLLKELRKEGKIKCDNTKPRATYWMWAE